MDDDDFMEQAMQRIVKDVSWKYAKRCWWQDRRDIEQQAWTVVLEVKKHYAPRDATGAIDRNAFGAWAYTAAMRQLSRWMWRESSPVSTIDHDVKNMAGVHRAPVFHAESKENSGRTPEDFVDEKRLLKAIEGRIFELCGNTIYVRATLMVLLQGDTPREVAEALGLEIWGIYRTTEWVKTMIRQDARLRHFAQELMERRES